MSLLRKVEYRKVDDLDANKPSLRHCGNKKGLELSAIKKLEHLGATNIVHVGQKLNLPINTIHTAVHYFHRFYAEHTFQEQDRLQVATACLFLATKVEESPRHLKEIIQQMYVARYRKHPSTRKKLLTDSVTYEMIKDRILVVERSLLYTIGFDFNVETPYIYLMCLTMVLADYIRSKFPNGAPQQMYVENPKTKTREHVSQLVKQGAWNFATDSLRLTLSLQVSSVKIAIVCFYLSMKLVNKTFDQCFEGLYHVEEGKPVFHKLWCDMMNFAHNRYTQRESESQRRETDLSKTQKEKLEEEDRKRVMFEAIKTEALSISFDKIQMCVKQITEMYEQNVMEDGQIVQPKFVKEGSGGGSSAPEANSNGKRPYTPTSPTPEHDTPYSPSSPSGNGSQQDKAGPPVEKKQKVGAPGV
ncbi:L-type cyclin [Chloropicon primus]|uniref:L-type cyclin n=2 Tax=Chloropicon primus TaxID=1764295 RepID=A0A5B8ME23_9CHLO|nr:L-type cyclin [Chloropicon primus]|eukprot:QDZ18846.1 L-type cyclin [Chloropicon primus]